MPGRAVERGAVVRKERGPVYRVALPRRDGAIGDAGLRGPVEDLRVISPVRVDDAKCAHPAAITQEAVDICEADAEIRSRFAIGLHLHIFDAQRSLRRGRDAAE